ncbi:MAG: bifunctional aldolase/short-chain dehydrogenase [Phycisphaerae bacterium]|jgi:rhamnulose-1-phosphate aldolase/alcohol dehydrogenase
MESQWTEQGAQDAVDHWAVQHGQQQALRLYTARLLGADPTLVLHGGGNVSLKGTHRNCLGDDVQAVWVKGSGFDLVDLDPSGLIGLDLYHLRRFRTLDELPDDDMVAEFRTHMFDDTYVTPSIETLVHAFLPCTYVDHSHADAVLTLTNQPNGTELIREALGDGVAILPYVKPGFDLAKAVADCHETHPDTEGIVLLHHGLITFGDDARTSYERHIAIVSACEQFVERQIQRRSLTPHFRSDDDPAVLAASIAPTLRGLLARRTGDEDHPYQPSILEWRHSDDTLAFANSREARELAATGPLTGDHLIRTKPHYLYVENPPWGDEQAVKRTLDTALWAYRRDYEAYVADHGGKVDRGDPAPRVALLPGAGLFAWGPTKREAVITADIAEHTLTAKARASLIGTYESLPPKHLYDMEFRGIQRAKLETGTRRPLDRQVVVISGGAGAIGAGVAEVCARAGAHVALTDIDEERLSRVVEHLDNEFGRGVVIGIRMDVTDETSVQDGFAEVVRTFGGLDVVVPNAGIAHVAAIENLEVDDFRKVMEVNAVGYLLFMREGVRILKRQGIGGHVIINASKNVFGPGKDFGAYSASKAAGHQLGKVAAIELAASGIRVNMINADAVFGDPETPSGLWATVGPLRAKTRGISESQLPDYYRRRNLLQARVHGHHVGNAVVFLASNATPTTGATLPVDGGVVEAFPR